MNILILSRHDERTEYDQVITYKSALSSSERYNSYEYGELESTVFSYNGTKLQVTINNKDVSEFDAVFMIGWFKTKILEDIALSVAMYANANNVKVLNSEVLYTRSRSKLSQYVVAALSGINMTPFLFCKDISLLRGEINSWQGGYPVIAKGVQASRGNDNHKLNNKDELLATIEHSNDIDGPWFVVQGFVPNNGDYRVIVMGDEVKMVIHRQAGGDSHLNNTSKGGLATNVEVEKLPTKVQEQCVTLAKALRREVTGVDVIQHIDSGEFFLLEINNMPQLATGTFVSEKMSALDSYFRGIV